MNKNLQDLRIRETSLQQPKMIQTFSNELLPMIKRSIFTNNPTTKHQIAECKSRNSPQAKETR